MLGIILPAIQSVRASAGKLNCQNNLKQLALACHGRHDSHSAWPPGLSLRAESGRYPYLGWPARVLPGVEQSGLWLKVEDAFATDPYPLTFYGHAAHAKLLGTPVPAFNCPSDPRLPGPAVGGSGLLAFTSYLGVDGTNQAARDGVF